MNTADMEIILNSNYLQYECVHQTMYYALNVHHLGNKLKCLQEQ